MRIFLYNYHCIRDISKEVGRSDGILRPETSITPPPNSAETGDSLPLPLLAVKGALQARRHPKSQLQKVQ